MAAGRTGRVTVVDPWIAGGEGQLRDLFPIPPLLILTWRTIVGIFRHYQLTALVVISALLWWKADWSWQAAFILAPILLTALRFLIVILYLWYRNPSIPLIARK